MSPCYARWDRGKSFHTVCLLGPLKTTDNIETNSMLQLGAQDLISMLCTSTVWQNKKNQSSAATVPSVFAVATPCSVRTTEREDGKTSHASRSSGILGTRQDANKGCAGWSLGLRVGSHSKASEVKTFHNSFTLLSIKIPYQGCLHALRVLLGKPWP